MKISIKESTIVRPARDTPIQHLWISTLDLLMVPRKHEPVVYFYKPTGSSSGFFQAQILKEALGKVLVPFYPLAGRLGKDESGRFEIVCNAEGVSFTEAEADESVLDDLADFAPSSQLQQLAPTVHYSGDISSSPLLLIQVTTFKCGRVSLGIQIHHALADGTSAIHFTNSWSDMERGQSPNISPFLDRTLLRSMVPPAPRFHHVEFDLRPSTNTPVSNPASLSESVFKITRDQINNLKAKCNKPGTPTKYSTFNILAAHVWRCISKARGLLDNQETSLSMPVNGRSRLHPPLPPGYFGNVIFRASTIALSGDLQTEPLMNTAERIRKTLNQMNDAYLKSALAYLEKAPMNQIFSSTPTQHEQRCPNLFIVSWQLPIHDADFGWGRPIFMGRTLVGEGMIYILRSPTDDGSLTLLAGLQTSHMKLFQKLICNP